MPAVCTPGHFKRPATSELQCDSCLAGTTCSENTDLATVNLSICHWRLGNVSRVVSTCATAGGFTPCRGGVSSGAAGGDGYCEPGYVGPSEPLRIDPPPVTQPAPMALIAPFAECELCDETFGSRYFDKGSARCAECPQPGPIVGILLGAAGVISGIVFLIYTVYTRPPTRLRPVANMMHRIVAAVRKLSLVCKQPAANSRSSCLVAQPWLTPALCARSQMPKLKIGIAFVSTLNQNALESADGSFRRDWLTPFVSFPHSTKERVRFLGYTRWRCPMSTING